MNYIIFLIKDFNNFYIYIIYMKKIISIFSTNLIIFLSLLSFIILIKKFNFSYKLFIIIHIFLFIITCIVSLIIKKPIIIAIGIIIFIVSIVFLIRIALIEKNYNNIIKNFENNKEIIGYINSYPKKKNDKIEYIVKVIGLKYMENEDYKKVKPFNVIFKFSYNDNYNLKRGDMIQIENKIMIPQKKIFNFKYREYLFNHKIYGIIKAKTENIKVINEKINNSNLNKVLMGTVWKFRDYLINLLNRSLSSESYSFIISIYLGERSEMDEELYQAFCNTGMIHLLAISGFNFTFIGMIFLGFFKIFLSKSKSLILSIIFLLFYMLIIVPSASSLRAFLMYVIFALYFITGIRSKALSILSLSAIILMFDNPYVIYDLGFQLSYSATAGILLFSDIINEKLPDVLNQKIKSSITVTFTAFISVFPLQWSVFKQVPFFSLISSIIVVPIFSIFFLVNFIFLIAFCITRFLFITRIIEILSFSFLKLINILDLVKPAIMPEIPGYLAYLTIPILVLYFYLLEPFLIKSFIKIKSKRVEKLITFAANSEKI